MIKKKLQIWKDELINELSKIPKDEHWRRKMAIVLIIKSARIWVPVIVLLIATFSGFLWYGPTITFSTDLLPSTLETPMNIRLGWIPLVIFMLYFKYVVYLVAIPVVWCLRRRELKKRELDNRG